MGVDTSISLSPQATLREVADVIGILLGNKKTWTGFNKNADPESGYVKVDEVKVAGAPNLPECADIDIYCPNAAPSAKTNGNDHRHFLYHFEFGDSGRRGLLPRAAAANIAIGVALIKFFGGKIDYQDCDEVEINESYPAPNDIKHRSNDRCFDSIQRRMMALEPLTEEEISKYQKYAAY